MKKVSFKVLLTITTFFFFQNIVHAGSLSISATRTSVTVGSTVVISVNASDLAGKFNVTSSNSSVLSGGESGSWIENGKVTYSFTAKKAGSATVTARPVDVADFSTGGTFSTSKSITIKVSEPVNYSSNNSLSSLSVDGATLSFSKETANYNISMPKGTTKINIKATAADSKATIAGIGEHNVEEGDNTFNVVVTAENGSTMTYTINVNVEEANPINIKINDKYYKVIKKAGLINASDLYKTATVKIDNFDIPAFINDLNKLILVGLIDNENNKVLATYKDGKYELYNELLFDKLKLYIIEDISKMPNSYSKYTIKISDKDIEVYKKERKSRFSLIYAMNLENGKKSVYQYDESENTIQRYNGSKIVNKKTIDMNILFKIGIILSGIIISFVLVIFIMAFKNKDKKNLS